MDAVFHSEFRADLLFWIKNDKKVAIRIFKLIEAITRAPFDGLGKPERLKYIDGNVWSRRITQEHRLVYMVRDKRIDFLQARYHY